MLNDTINGAAIGKTQGQWLESLEAYLEQLQNIDAITKQVQRGQPDLQRQREVATLRNRILMQKNVIGIVIEEVSMFKKLFASHCDKKILSMSDLLENSRLRDKVIKAEQQVMLLKYEVNQLLSRAS